MLGTELMDGENCIHVKSELIYKDCTATVFGSLGMPSKYAGGALCFSLEIIGENAMITFDSSNKFILTTNIEESIEVLDTYDAYESELRYFIDCVNNNIKPDMCNIYQAKIPIEIACAIVRSSQDKKLIKMI